MIHLKYKLDIFINRLLLYYYMVKQSYTVNLDNDIINIIKKASKDLNITQGDFIEYILSNIKDINNLTKLQEDFYRSKINNLNNTIETKPKPKPKQTQLTQEEKEEHIKQATERANLRLAKERHIKNKYGYLPDDFNDLDDSYFEDMIL